jgi:ribosomal protein S18 acetylase RimI-like enzyme
MLISLNKFFKLKFKNKEQIEKAHEQKYKFLLKFTSNINTEYLKTICSDSNNKILLYTINEKLTENYKNEIVGIVVYRIILHSFDIKRIYISLISIHEKMRSLGYGSVILDEFIAKYQKNKTLELVLLSLQSSYDFYKKLGFEKSKVKYIQKNEIIDDCIIMAKKILCDVQ